MVALTLAPLVFAQDQDSVAAEQASLGMSRRINHVFNYLNMAGTLKASEFQPLTQDQRTRICVNTMVSPLGYLKAGFSAGIDQLKDTPSEWEQGASGYGKAAFVHGMMMEADISQSPNSVAWRLAPFYLAFGSLRANTPPETALSVSALRCQAIWDSQW